MADLSEAMAVLAATAAAALYPAGSSDPSAVGVGVKIYAGWPNAQQLDADLRAAPPVCHVSIYPRPEERNTTRYSPNDWKQVSVNTATLTLVVAGQTVTVGGTVPDATNPHHLAIIANSRAYAYAPVVGDTLASIAAALAALIAPDLAGTTAAGAVLTLPNTARLQAARVGVNGTALRELRRQERLFQIGVWADSPGHRDAIAGTVDVALAAMAFLAMPDGTAARVRYKSSTVSDALQKDCLFRRDLMYTVEYATTQTETDSQITVEQLEVFAAVAGVPPFAHVETMVG